LIHKNRNSYHEKIKLKHDQLFSSHELTQIQDLVASACRTKLIIFHFKKQSVISSDEKHFISQRQLKRRHSIKVESGL